MMLVSCKVLAFVLQFMLSLGPAAHAAAYPSKLVCFLQFGFCSIMLDIAMNFLMENSFQIFAGSMDAQKRLAAAEIVQKCVLRAVCNMMSKQHLWIFFLRD
jgi:hypothetical protein